MSFERLRKISKLVGLTLTKDLIRSEKISLILYLFAFYVYGVLFVSRKFNLSNEIDELIYVIAYVNVVPLCTIMRINREKLADLLIRLETKTDYKIKRAAELRSELERTFWVMSLVPVGIGAYAVGILTDKKNTLPFGGMPAWMMNFSYTACFIFQIPLFTIEFLKISIYVLLATSLFFGDCYTTQRVIEENEALAFSCYNVDFVGTNITFQKSLILLMARMQKSVQFTIGKFATLSVVAIVAIFYSYFTLLQNRRKQ